MKIALVTTEFYPFRGGGIGTYCESICRVLVEKGHEVHVITSVPGPERVFGAFVHRCKIPYNSPAELMPERFRKWELSLSDPNYLAAYCWADEIKKVVDKYDIEIIESQECMAPTFYFQYKQMLDPEGDKIPVIIHLHTPCHEIAIWDQRPLENPQMHMIRFMEDFSISMADAVISPSRFLADHVSNRLPDIKNKLDVIPYPLHEQSFEKIHADINKSTKEIVYAGRLEHRKGIETLVNALKKVLKEENTLKVRFIGKSMYSHVRGMQYADWIAGKLSEFADRIIFDGLIDRYQAMSKMHAADCVVIPSVGENFPNVCIEAMLCGSVIVASDSGGMAEMMGGEENGFLFEGSNVNSLVAALGRALALTDPERSRIREAATFRIKSYCNIEKIADQRTAHYRKIQAECESGKREKNFPVSIICGNTSEEIHDVKRIETVAAVILDDGKRPVEGTLDSVLQGSRIPDEILVLSYGVRRNQQTLVQPDKSVPIKQLWINSNDLSEIKNLALTNVDTDALFYLHTTNVIRKEFVDTSVNILNQYQEVGYLQSWVGSKKHVAVPIPPFMPFILYNNCFVTPVGMIRKQALEQINGFSEGFVFHYLDWHTVLSMMEKGWISVVLDEVLVETEKYDYESRRELEFEAGNLLYQRLVGKNKQLFDRYQNTLLVAAGSMISTSGIYRLSANERTLLRMYRLARKEAENIMSKIPYLKNIVNR